MQWFHHLWPKPAASSPGTQFSQSISSEPSVTNTSVAPTPQARVLLQTADGNELYLSKADLSHLNTIHRMAIELDILNNRDLIIKVSIALNSQQLNKIVEWFRHRAHNPKESFEASTKLVFTNPSVLELISLIDVALFLDTQELVDGLSCVAAGVLVKMETSKIRVELGRENIPLPSADQMERTEKMKQFIA